MKINKWNEDREHITERKYICIVGIIIIFFGLLLGYWTAWHIYAEDGITEPNTEDTETEVKDTTNDNEELKKMLEKLDKKIEELEKQVNEKIEMLDEDNKLILNYLEIEQELEEVKKEVKEALEPPETKAPAEEEPKDTETQYQYYPYLAVIIGLLLIQVFRRKH